MKKTFKIALAAVILLLLIIAGYTYWRYQELNPSTDDAYIQANVVNIAAQVSGPIANIYTTNLAYVDKNAPLFAIDPTPFQIAVNKAEANLTNITQQIQALEAGVDSAEALVAERQAQLTDTEKQTQRTLELAKHQQISQAQADDAIANLHVAKASLAAAQSQLEQIKEQLGTPGDNNAQIREAKAEFENAKLNLQYTTISAPASGHVVKFDLRQGSMIQALQPLFVLIEDNHWWVNANFKETQLQRIRPGQPATIHLDIYPDHIFHGIVDSISAGSGSSFSLLPPEDATGNWVKVTQRFPVKIIITDPDPKHPLRVGASSTVTIHTIKATALTPGP